MTEQDTQPPRVSKGERTRSRILDSATELFSQFGFQAVSLRDISAHAGLTHAGLLHHFSGKESLLLKILSRRDAADARLLFGDDDEAELLAALIGFVERNTRTPAMVGLYVKVAAEATDPEHPAHPYFKERYRRLRARLAAILGVLFAEAGVEHDPASAALQLIALLDGLQTQWLIEPEAVDMRGEVLAFLQRLGLRPTNLR